MKKSAIKFHSKILVINFLYYIIKSLQNYCYINIIICNRFFYFIEMIKSYSFLYNSKNRYI